jgi:hypothetical protein
MDGDLLEEIANEYDGNNHVRQVHRNFQESNYEIVTTYEYDDRNNLIKWETKDFSDNLTEFWFGEYDEYNRLISEMGRSNYHIIHRYE